MKVLYIRNTPDGGISVDAGADSSVLRTGEPVFVPDPVDGWLSAVAPAVRISRLGTAIKAARARAYYDSLAPVHLLRPADASLCHGLPPGILDRALSPGEWLPLDEEPHSYAILAELSAIGADKPFASASALFSLEAAGVDKAIELLSQYLSFRTGDILVFPEHGISLGTPTLDTELRVCVDGHEALRIRIK
ncbi:MAG: hypothetical protein NC418_09470 [Muribaculaceae bacterium]|nr:hypothetical protein [Muribaculaceae bacterium]